MITLEQARKIVDIGDELTHQLSKIDAQLRAFRSVESETVECRAYASVPDGFGRPTGTYVTLLPVAKSVAISALERERSKAVAKLAELGVDVSSMMEAQVPTIISGDMLVADGMAMTWTPPK